jgi:TonB family protein
MNRLQKKCVIATAGFHLLLLVILFVGPAFFNEKPKVDDAQVLNFVSPDAIEAAINNGVQRATPPPPAPIVTPPTPPVPQPTIVDRLEKYFKPEPVKATPVPPDIQPHTPKVDLHLVTHIVPKISATNPKPNSQALKNVADTLRNQLSSPTQVGMPGDSNVAQANYASIVRTIYDRAWTLPDNVAGENEIVKVSVTIASDGTVINARIITSSGDATLDTSVQRTLERVSFVAPFLTGMTEKEWTRTISFNPETKQMSE